MNSTTSDSLSKLRNELTTWYMSLDERNEYYFDRVYEHDARVLVNALGGYTITAEEIGHYSTLAALLGVDADGEASDVVPHIALSSSPVTQPASAQADQAFKLEWVDINYGTASPGYQDAVFIHDGSNPVFEGQVTVGPLDKGAQTQVQIDVPGLQAGTYNVRVLHNFAGTAPEYAQYADRSIGFASVTDAEFTVSAAAGN